MKIQQSVIDQADKVLRIKSPDDLPFTNMLKIMALGSIRETGFYSFVQVDDATKQETKVLIIADYEHATA